MRLAKPRRTWLIVGAIVDAAAVTVAAILFLVVPWDAVRWGTVGEWVAGLGALVPLAFWAVDRRARLRAEAELKAERRRSQIRGISWRETTWDTPDRLDNTRTWVARNDSDAPLRNVYLHGRAYAHHPFPKTWLQVPSQGSGALGKGQERVFLSNPVDVYPLRNFRLSVRDADGVLWVLDEQGYPTETERLNDTFDNGDPDDWPGYTTDDTAEKDEPAASQS
ncbi:hypothetical protein [Isoptericola sp. NPDC019482]|uniref:hypothetical protein n=1 Tax=Isoptericola sp. NPDC019482 TaxID=3154688 RepID=UPI00346AD811